MKIALSIIRVSSQDQLKGYGPDVQWQDDIIPNALLLGLEVSEQYRRIVQESATTWERVKFEGLMMEAISLYQKKEIEALLFPRVDRETRFIYSSFPLLCDVIKSGLKVFFARERFELDPNNPESTEKYLNKAMQSESYIRTMTANTTRAKEKLVTKGILPTGTGHGLYGFRWDKEIKKRIPIEYEVKIVEKIFGMLADGISRFKVAETLNKQGIPTKHHGSWHPLTIARMAANPAYIGTTYFYQTRGSSKTQLVRQDKSKWAVLQDATPAVIDPALFERVQERLRQQKEARCSVNTRHYLLRSYAYCGLCGSPLVGTCLNKKFLYYHCRGTMPTSTRGPICNARYIRAERLEQLVWDKVMAILSNPETVLAELRKQAEAEKAHGDITSLDKEIKSVEHRLKEYPNQEKRLINTIKLGQLGEDLILDEINRIKAQEEADIKQISELKQTKIHLGNLATAEAKLSEFYDSIRQRIEQCTDEDKRLAFEALALKVKATPELVEIAGVIPVDITTTQSSDPLLTIARTSAL